MSALHMENHDRLRSTTSLRVHRVQGVAGIREAGPVSWTRDEFAPGLAPDFVERYEHFLPGLASPSSGIFGRGLGFLAASLFIRFVAALLAILHRYARRQADALRATLAA